MINMHNDKIWKKNVLHVLSLQRKRNEKRGKCIFIYSYIVENFLTNFIFYTDQEKIKISMKGNSEIKLDKCHIIYQKHNASTWHGQFMINLFSLRLGKLKMSLYHNC